LVAEDSVGTHVVRRDDSRRIPTAETRYLGVQAQEPTRISGAILLARRVLIDVENRVRDQRDAVWRSLREKEMVAGLAFVSDNDCFSGAVRVGGWHLRPFVRPTESQYQLGEIAGPAQAVGVDRVFLEDCVQHTRKVLG